MPLTIKERLKVGPLLVQHSDHQRAACDALAEMRGRPLAAQDVKDMIADRGAVF